MSVARVTEWRKLPLSLTELCIDTTLRCGQSFRWRKINNEWLDALNYMRKSDCDTEYEARCCTLYGRILSLKQDPTHLHYKVTWPAKPTYPLTPPVVDNQRDGDDTEELLRHYLSLKLNLKSLYEQWSAADPNFRKRAPEFRGVRMLSQDAWEALICFICSSNNNISRISQMRSLLTLIQVHKLCIYYGPLIGHIGDEPFHDFPPPEALTGSSVEAHLRELGFGYRAKYIAQTASIIVNERPRGWFEGLTNPENPCFRKTPEGSRLPQNTYKEAHEKLLQLAGVGPKVADCVCLMGLGWGEAVPVDTHVWQIAQRDYKFGKSKTKTFNKTMYDAVGDHFRELWGKYAGWAHSVLFTADLKTFSGRTVKKEEGEEEGEGVTLKKEVIDDQDAPVLGTKRKVVKTKVEVEVDHDVHQTASLESSPKRRRTRSQARKTS
ncbi:N-glycosylase/DNA lyase [Colletotrichum tanaceti]|uniref:DNA-(apurinic or apyrimidinic site) lyase n=1 Tax=Colletotrichum tanaceti TaxID=1306861 RepID=A0A4U6X7A8_9PEZI|nr:N-glycosylase/DNA lyase [Colletotrichum tanaceti]TKW51360.1 N-glycosylase/DNA lyase [Colletotrichum tanaceti]